MPGKANNRWNRVLLDSYLAAAKSVLTKEGKCIVTLCPDQSGWHSKSSAMAAQLEANPCSRREQVLGISVPFDINDPIFREDDIYYPMGHRNSGGRFSAFQGHADMFCLQQAQPGVRGYRHLFTPMKYM